MNMMKCSTRWVGLSALALALAACGGGDGNSPQVSRRGAPDSGTGSDGPLGASSNASSTSSSTSSSGHSRALALPPGTVIPATAPTKGLFGPVQSWPQIPIHAVLTPDGRVLSYGTDSTGRQTGYFNYSVWDSANNTHTSLVNGTGTDIFCSSQLLLAAGDQVFIAGGDIWTGTATTNSPNNNSNLFTVANNALTRGPNMNRARWYSSSTMLLNGEVYIQGGSGGGDLPEIRGTDGSMRLLTGAGTSALDATFPRNYVAPDGRLFGFDSNGKMYYVDPTGAGSVTQAGQFNSAYAGSDGSAAMFAPGRILQFGGNSSGAIVIDINGSSPAVTTTSSMAYQRRLGTATVMANGQVLATGGSSVWNVMTNVAYEAEIWNPTTGQWTRGANYVKARLYHSMAMLLPDASVLVGGGGAPGPQNNLNAEIYYPPYLFNASAQLATRPTITTAPTVVSPGQTVQVAVNHNRSVSRVTFVRTGAVTHSWATSQRFVDLPFTGSNGALSVQIPARSSDVPPGTWMMFVLDDQGVPSVAKMVRVNIAGALNTAVTPNLVSPGNQTSTVGTATTVQLSASDPNGDTLTYSASGLPAGLTIASNTGRISGTPTTAGTFTVVLAASDGINSSSKTITWTVNAGSTPLVLTAPTPPAPSAATTGTTFTASATGTGVMYSWTFGDGTAATPFSSTASATHFFANPGIYYVTVTARDAAGNTQLQSMMHQVYLPAAPTGNSLYKPTNSSPLLYEVRTGANARLWQVNPDNNSVTVFDAVTRAKLAEVAVGTAPRTLAQAPGGAVWVVNKGSDSISVISNSTLAVSRTVALPRGSQPYGIAMAAASGTALVTLEATGSLVKLNTSNFNTMATVAVGANARHLAILGDGSTAYVTRFITPPLAGESTGTLQTTSGGGQVVAVNSGTMSVLRTIVLGYSNTPDAENQGRGIPNYLGAVAVSPDAVQAFVPSKQDNIGRGLQRDGLVLNFQNTVRAISSKIHLIAAAEDITARIDHDNASMASAAAFDPLGVFLFVALETSREVAVIDAYSRNQIMRLDVGRAPQGLVVSPDRRTLFVHNFMDRTVSAFDLSPLVVQGRAGATLLGTMSAVATERLAPNVLLGKQHFYDARDTRLARDRYMSCASCHNDGGHDGRVWDLTAQGEGLRNTISLRGRAGAQGRLHWSANFDEVQDFEGQIRSLAAGTGLMTDAQFNTGTRNQPLGDRKAGVSADLDALAAYVGSLATFDLSPARSATGALTTAAVAGRTVFQAQCVACHGGNDFTDSAAGVPHNVGTLKPTSGTRLGGPLTGIDTPTLRDAWATAPYLHDGSAPTVEDAVRAHNSFSLSATDLANVSAFVRQIGREEPAVTPAGTGPRSSAIFGPASGTTFTDPVAANQMVTGIYGRVGTGIIALQGLATPSNLPLHGGTGGSAGQLNFPAGVSLVRIFGSTTTAGVAQLGFELSNGWVLGPYGQAAAGSTPFDFRVPAGSKVVGFTGRSSTVLNAIGVLYLP